MVKPWKSKIQLSNYPKPIQKPDMLLPKIKSHIGGTYPEEIWDGITKDYERYSKLYWEKVRARQM